MAINVATVWEVRATGSNSNGGGFVPGSGGTDWTQQAAPQYALTGVTSAGAGSTILSAAAAADMVGNVLNCDGSGTNFTAGFYPVLSVVVGVSITVDLNNQGNPICSGAGVGGVCNIGGALFDLSIVTRAVYGFTQANDGNTFYIMNAAGPYVYTGHLQDFDLNFFTVIGYGATRGDGVQASITTSTNSTEFFAFGNGGFSVLFYNIAFSNTAGTPAACFDFAGNNVQGLFFQNCSWAGFTTAVFGPQPLSHGEFLFCTATACTSDPFVFSLAVDLAFDGCFIFGNGGNGVSINPNGSGTSSVANFNRCVVYNNAGDGVIRGPSGGFDGGGQCAMRFWNCDIVGNGGDGINNVGNSSVGQTLFLFNNIISENTGFGVNASGAGPVGGAGPIQAGESNAYYNNGSGALNNFPSLPGDVTLSAQPFTSPTGGDFTLNSTAGGGAACKGVGFPSVLP